MLHLHEALFSDGSIHDKDSSDLDDLLGELWKLHGGVGSRQVTFHSESYSCHITPTRKAHALSPREYEIARLIADGHPNKAIAKTLSISEHTVASHLRRIFAKLETPNRAAMVKKLFAWDL